MTLSLSPTTLLLAKARNREACAAIAGQVYRVVAAVLGPSSPDVADVTQTAFLRVFESLSTFEERGDASAKAWVNAIAARVAIDQRRRARRYPPLYSFDDAGGEALSAEVAVDLDARIGDAELVRVLLDELTEEERAALVMRYWSGLGDEDAARELGVPLGTLKSRLRRAGDKLRELVRAGVAAR